MPAAAHERYGAFGARHPDLNVISSTSGRDDPAPGVLLSCRPPIQIHYPKTSWSWWPNPETSRASILYRTARASSENPRGSCRRSSISM